MTTHAHKANPRNVPRAPRDDNGLEQYYTLADTAEKLKMSRQTLYTHILAGRVKTRKFGRYSVISESEVQRFSKKLRPISVAGKQRMVYVAA
jgi:hypothetical protein